MTKLKKFYNISTRGKYYKTFLGVIYSTGSIFSYDFNWGYAEKKFYNIGTRLSSKSLASIREILDTDMMTQCLQTMKKDKLCGDGVIQEGEVP